MFAPGNILNDHLAEPENFEDVNFDLTSISSYFKGHFSETVQPRFLSESKKSRTYLVEIGNKNIFIKKHLSRALFKSELTCYLLTKGAPRPKLDGFDLEKAFLVTDYTHSLGPSFELNALEVFELICKFHIFINLNMKAASYHLGTNLSFNKLIKHEENQQCKDFLRTYRATLPSYFAPMSVGDIKPEHIRLNGGSINLVDFDTFQIGRPPLHDVLCLMNFYPNAGQFWNDWSRYFAEKYIATFNLGCNKDQLTNLLYDYLKLCEEGHTVK